MFGKLPTLPFVVPLGVLVFLMLLWFLRRRGQLTLARGAVAAAAALYLAGIVANTVFPIYLAWPKSEGPRSLPLYLVPIVGYEVDDAVTNALLFIPLGILVALMLTRPTLLRVALIGTGISLAIELSQFTAARFAHGGHIADVNDWLSNTAGAVIGYGVYRLLGLSPVLSRWMDHFRWQRSALDERRPAAR